jgi:bifunctional DNA-binding transcriptional regulator/antitoxin component of YhaV-PrlF toxin-antitoxin module
LREEYGLEEGDEVVWIAGENGITVRKATKSAGRGLLVDDDVSETTREAMAEEMESVIRELRRTAWAPSSSE